MLTVTSLRIALIACSFAIASCEHSHDEDAYQTLEACYDEHHNDEMLTIQRAIVVCCLDHPIAGQAPSCGDTAPACVTHVRAELDASVSTMDIEAACTDYIAQK